MKTKAKTNAETAAQLMLNTLLRIAASDPNNSQFAVLVMAEAKEAVQEAQRLLSLGDRQ